MSDKEKLEATVRAANEKLAILRGQETLAEGRKLVGQCFRYRNCYSVPQKPSDYWPLYMKVISADSSGLTVFDFQTDKYGETSIRPSRREYARSVLEGSTKITAAQFNKAWRTAQKRIADYRP